MNIQRAPSRFAIFLTFLTLYFFFSFAQNALSTQSTCVSCHTEESTLTTNLSQEKEKKSALTSGAG